MVIGKHIITYGYKNAEKPIDRIIIILSIGFSAFIIIMINTNCREYIWKSRNHKGVGHSVDY